VTGAALVQSLAVHRSRKLIPEFVLHRPTTLAQACTLLDEYGGGVSVIAGGIDVISRMKTGTGSAQIVSISDIAEMHGIRRVTDRIEIGATVTHREIEVDPLIKSTMPSVAEYVSALGNIRIRCQGTIGGNVMADEPGYEILPLLLVLDAALNFCDPATGAACTVSAREFARTGTAPRPFVLLTSISIPISPISLIWNRDLRPTMAMVAGVQRSNGRPTAARAALVGMHRRAVWGPVALGDNPETSHDDDALSTPAGRWANALPSSDLAEGPNPIYARRVAAVMLRRALADAGLAA
jgi:aerobic carbon-monoxide dehydrogenase medium subunit